MRVAVIGAGAMGSLISYLLDAAGIQLVLYESREERVAEVRANGIRLRGAIDGRAYPDARLAGEPADPFDFIILAVAAGEGGDALRPLSPFVHRDTRYLSLQEGSAVQELAQLVGENRAGGAVSRVSASRTEEGEVEVEELRTLLIGGFAATRDAAFKPLVETINAGGRGKAELCADLKAEMWGRLESAAAVSGLCGVLGGAPEEIKGLDEVDALCRDAAEECRAVAALPGSGTSRPGSAWEEAVWKWIKPPLLVDLEAGRATEVDYLSGHIVKRARAQGQNAPIHSALLSVIREMESGKRSPGENSFKELLRRIQEERGMKLL